LVIGPFGLAAGLASPGLGRLARPGLGSALPPSASTSDFHFALFSLAFFSFFLFFFAFFSFLSHLLPFSSIMVMELLLRLFLTGLSLVLDLEEDDDADDDEEEEEDELDRFFEI
jgi:hypothetical protein